MILSFADGKTVSIFAGGQAEGLPADIQQRAREKLRALDAAANLKDLETPPGNRLEALNGNRAGQHSIRINRQWRICFHWDVSDAEDVEIVDYH